MKGHELHILQSTNMVPLNECPQFARFHKKVRGDEFVALKLRQVR